MHITQHPDDIYLTDKFELTIKQAAQSPQAIKR
jgi:hypothetical protein